MRWPRRATRIPDDARAALGLAPGERVLAAARSTDGSWLVATDRGLVAPGVRLDWSSITHAQWYDEETALSVAYVDDTGAVGEHTFHVADPGLLPETVHERVVATILLSRHLPVTGRRGVRVVARRQPGSDELVWQVVPDPGIDPNDPQVSARVRAAVQQMRTELGG
jgi:hypothetical protein